MGCIKCEVSHSMCLHVVEKLKGKSWVDMSVLLMGFIGCEVFHSVCLHGVEELQGTS